jgi:hypothetical protein
MQYLNAFHFVARVEITATLQMKPCIMYMIFALFWEQWFLLFYLCLQQRSLCLYFSSETMQFWCCHLCVFLFLYVQWNVHLTSLDLICMYFDKANLLIKLRDFLENCIYENNAHRFYEIVATAPMGENGDSNASLGASRPSHLFCPWWRWRGGYGSVDFDEGAMNLNYCSNTLFTIRYAIQVAH